MQMKWAFALIAAAAMLAAWISPSGAVQESVAYGEFAMTMKTVPPVQSSKCYQAAGAESTFQRYSDGGRDYYWSATDQLVCEFLNGDLDRTFVAASRGDATHRIASGMNRSGPYWRLARL